MNTQETLNRTNFTLYEARAIVEIVRPGFEHSTLGLTEAVEHGLEDGLADEWDIDSESLRAKLRDLAPDGDLHHRCLPGVLGTDSDSGADPGGVDPRRRVSGNRERVRRSAGTHSSNTRAVSPGTRSNWAGRRRAAFAVTSPAGRRGTRRRAAERAGRPNCHRAVGTPGASPSPPLRRVSLWPADGVLGTKPSTDSSRLWPSPSGRRSPGVESSGGRASACCVLPLRLGSSDSGEESGCVSHECQIRRHSA